MTRNVRIASVLALAGWLSVMAPTIASAGTPLLSGYGGPGAGEQAIVGSVLLAPHGSGGSGGSSSGSAGSGAPQSSVSASGGSTSSPTTSGGGPTVRSGSSSSTPSKSGGGTGGAAPQTGVRASAKATYVYPSSLRSNSTDDSSLLGLSAGDVLALIAMILILGCVGALTLRLARLQP